MLAWNFGFWVGDACLWRRRPPATVRCVYRILCCNVLGLSWNLSDITVVFFSVRFIVVL